MTLGILGGEEKTQEQEESSQKLTGWTRTLTIGGLVGDAVRYPLGLAASSSPRSGHYPYPGHAQFQTPAGCRFPANPYWKREG